MTIFNKNWIDLSIGTLLSYSRSLWDDTNAFSERRICLGWWILLRGWSSYPRRRIWIRISIIWEKLVLGGTFEWWITRRLRWASTPSWPWWLYVGDEECFRWSGRDSDQSGQSVFRRILSSLAQLLDQDLSSSHKWGGRRCSCSRLHPCLSACSRRSGRSSSRCSQSRMPTPSPSWS